MSIVNKIKDLYDKANKSQGLKSLEVMAEAFELIPDLLNLVENKKNMVGEETWILRRYPITIDNLTLFQIMEQVKFCGNLKFEKNVEISLKLIVEKRGDLEQV